MNTMITSTDSTRLKVLIAAAILGAVAANFPPVTRAADASVTGATVVRYADLDIATTQGAATLYNRIHAAAAELCSPLGHGDLSSTLHKRTCVTQSVKQAVTDINEPALSQVYAARNGTGKQISLLTAQQR